MDRESFARASQIVIAASTRVCLEDRAAELGRELQESDVERMTWAMVQLVGQAGAVDYTRALQTLHRIGREVAQFLTRYDVLLTPTLATPPVALGELSLSREDVPALMERLLETIGFTQLFNAAGVPAMSVPLHWNAEGLPIGVQFAGRFGDEATLFRLAAQLEAARPWFDRRPAGTSGR